MGFVFLSYSSADRSDARKLVDALRARSIDVWWDVDRRHEVNEWSPDIGARLASADRILALVTRNVVESPRDFVFAEMFLGREKLKLIALQVGELALPYKYQSIMIGLNRRVYQSFDQILEAEALDDISGACGKHGLGKAAPTSGESNLFGLLGNDVSAERVALAVATAALEELPVGIVVDAARDLESRFRSQLAGEGELSANLFRQRSHRLRDIGAMTFELIHPRLNVPVSCVRFASPQQRFAVLEYAWDEMDGLRGSLLAWFDAMAASSSPDVRASIGLVIGVIARKRFATVLDQVLARWILGEDPALRDVADLAFRVALDEPTIERAVVTQVRDWARGNSLPAIRAAIELACGYTGSRMPGLGIDTLKAVAKANIAGVDAVTLMREAIDYLATANREAADGSLFDLSKLLTGICGWADEALPQKGHRMLPLILFFELIQRLPVRSPAGVPGVLALQAVMADPAMTRTVARIFDLALRAGDGPLGARGLARDCLKRLCRRADELARRGRLADDPVLHLVRKIYSTSPTDRDRERLVHTVKRTYSRDDIEARPAEGGQIIDGCSEVDADIY